MDAISFLLLFLLFTMIGIGIGAGTGLAPGIHVNNVAALLLATQGAWVAFAASVAPVSLSAGEAATLLASFLVAASASHAVFGFVPSVFFGAPSEDTALSVLPGHRMLLQGQGVLAIALAGRGAVFGALVSVALLIPLRFILAEPVHLFETFRPFTATFLVALMLALILSELRGKSRWRRIERAAVVQALAGVLGIAVLRGPSPIPAESILLPLFSGLFGLPGLILSLRKSSSPVRVQRGERPGSMKVHDVLMIGRGTLAGASVSWLPGLSGGAAAAIATIGSRRSDAPSFMTMLGAVATSTAILSVAVLFIIGRARSGVAAAIRDLAPPGLSWQPAWNVPSLVVALLASSLLAAAISAPLAAWVASAFGRRWSALNPRRLSLGVLGVLLVLIAVLTGPQGVLVACIAAAVGLIPPTAGVHRVHLMAALLAPVALGLSTR